MLIGRVGGGPAQIRRSGRGGRAAPDADGAFGAHLLETGEADEAPASQLAATQQAASMAGLAAIGALPQPDRSDAALDRRAKNRGQTLLAALGDLQLAFLDDGTGAALETLSRLAADASPAADPRLQAVLRAIDQRVAIEVAKAGGRA